MSQAADPRSVTIPAVPEQVRAARAFVSGALGESCAQAEVALLLASELVTNSAEHSGPAVAGGGVTVTVAAGDKVVQVEVTGRSGDGVPVLRPAAEAADGEAEGGRGPWLVDMLSARWGYQRGGLATTWFEILAQD
jgi:anti-sigma regulatory factor (Ser/Thr protein kinase)